jgi:hypothetical protein
MNNVHTIEAQMNSYSFDFVKITYEDLNMRGAPVRVEAHTEVPAHTRSSGHGGIARSRNSTCQVP